jgi:hypothetical protein
MTNNFFLHLFKNLFQEKLKKLYFKLLYFTFINKYEKEVLNNMGQGKRMVTLYENNEKG